MGVTNPTTGTGHKTKKGLTVMFTASKPSLIPALARKLRAARRVTARLKAPPHKGDLGMGLLRPRFDNKGRMVLVEGYSLATRKLDLYGRELYRDIKSLTAAIAAERLKAPIDA